MTSQWSMKKVKTVKLRLAFVMSCFVSFIIGCEYVRRLHFCVIMKEQHLIERTNTPFLSKKQTRQLPHSIVIGVKKAGTRALLKFLRLHTDVIFKGQEMHFFDKDEAFERGFEYYRKEMPQSYDHQITMEKTPNYFTEPFAPERIYQMNNSIRLILIVRDPVTRLVSDYVDGKEKARRNNTLTYPTFESLVFDEKGRIDQRYAPVLVSTYHIFFSKWLAYFRREQIHVVNGDNFVENPAEELYKIESFLGLQHQLKRDTFYFNKTKGFYCVRGVRKGAFKRSCLGNSKGRQHPHLDSVTMQKLKNYFKYPNKLFFEIAGQRFNW